MVGVLVLVDADVAEAFLVLLEHLGARAQQVERAHEQVVEVHGVGGAQAALQFQVHLTGFLLLWRARLFDELLRADHGVFGRGDLGADHVDGVLLLLDGELRHDLAHHAAGVIVVIDGELAGVAQQVGILPQDAHAHGVERADPHAAHAAIGQHGGETLAHLGRSLVGERDSEDLPGANAQVTDHARDAERQHARLARAGARKDEQRAFGGEDRLALSRVQGIDVHERAGGHGVHRGTGCRDVPRGGVRRRTFRSGIRRRGLIVRGHVSRGNLAMIVCGTVDVERHEIRGGRGPSTRRGRSSRHVPQVRLIRHALTPKHIAASLRAGTY